jgi:hypothetical protein
MEFIIHNNFFMFFLLMKIALCFRGHLRTFEKTFSNLKLTLLDKYDVDIFMHTWDKYNVNGEQVVRETVQNLYNPKSLLISDQQMCFSSPIFNSNYNKLGFKFQIFSISSALKLMNTYINSTGTQYDKVILARPDFIFNEKIYEVLDTNGISTLPNYKYYDLCIVCDKKYIDKFYNLFKIKKTCISKRYRTYGLNPLIKHVIQSELQNEHFPKQFGWLVR